jgi:hypothetical protein
MDTTLRPLSLGEILDRTATIYRKNFWLLAGISTVYAGSVMLLGLVQIGIKAALGSNLVVANLFVSLFGLIELPVILIMAGLCIAAINRSVAWIHLSQPATIRGAYGSVWPKLGRYIWLMFLVGLRIYWPMIVIFIPVIILAAIAGVSARGSGGSTAALAMIGVLSLVTIVLSIGAAVYMVWQALRLALSVPCCVVEDLNAVDSMNRSIQLTEGSRGRIFVLGLLVAVIQMGLTFIGMIPFFVFGWTEAMKHNGQFSIGILIMQQAISFLITSFVTPIYSTGFMLFYYDQRIRKEGFDIEWMMQAAGLSAPAQSAAANAAPATWLDAAQLDSAQQEPRQVNPPSDSAGSGTV